MQLTNIVYVHVQDFDQQENNAGIVCSNFPAEVKFCGMGIEITASSTAILLACWLTGIRVRICPYF